MTSTVDDRGWIIVAENVVKKFGEKTAVDGISLKIEKGEIYGFLGPNGAGKTTTVRMLCTLTEHDEGTITIDGFDVSEHPLEAKTRVGVIQQHISLDSDLTVIENMRYRALMHQLPKKQREDRIKELIDYFELDDYVDSKIESLSGGWKKKVSIICALIHSPEIVFLDEPTVGLDIGSRRLLWELVRKLNRGGTTVFLTTHYIEEAQALCSRVGIIDRGRIIATGSPRELSERVGKFTVIITDKEGKSSYEYFEDRSAAREFTNSLADGEVLIRKTNLEDCFVELTGRKVSV